MLSQWVCQTILAGDMRQINAAVLCCSHVEASELGGVSPSAPVGVWFVL